MKSAPPHVGCYGRFRPAAAFVIACLAVAPASFAEEPSAAYIFPAGGQHGTIVPFRVGGHFFHGEAHFEMLGPGVIAAPWVRETNTIWFEGPVIAQPASQAKEDYPRDHAGSVQLTADATPGLRHWRVWTSQGATPSMKFVVGDLPEIVEQERDGAPLPVEVKPPVTINGRIFPRENVDEWTFAAKAGQEFTCSVAAQSLGSPLQARIVACDASGRQLAEAVATQRADPQLRFRAPADGRYTVRIHDVSFAGLQHYVYRLTITSEPVVNSVFPLGARRGETVKLELNGQSLPARTADVKIPTDAAKTFSTSLNVGGKPTNPLLIEVDDLPEMVERAGETPALRREFTPPAVLNGRITKQGETDTWSFVAKKGDALELTLAAARLGSPLTPILTVSDAQDKQLGRAEAGAGEASDTTLQFKAPEDGTYVLRITERFASRSGADFAYRLRVAPPREPDFQLTLVSDALNVLRDLPDGLVADPAKKTKNRQKPGQLKLNIAMLGGFAGEIELVIDGLPDKVTAANTKIAARKPTHDLTFAAEPMAKIAATRITVRGTAMINGQSVTRVATLPLRRGELPVDTVLLAVALPTPFTVGGEYSMQIAPRGAMFRKHYTIERGGFTGPLTVQLADRQGRHLQGVTSSPLVVPSGADSFEYRVFLPPWMELGRTSRSVIATLGVLKDHDGTEHIVSFSAGEQNDQIIAVTATGLLDVEAHSRSLAVAPGKTVTLSLHVQRDKTLAAESVRVELQLPSHIRGVKAEPVVIPPGQDEATLHVQFANDAGPFNAPATLRASTIGTSEPHVAETKVELVPPASDPVAVKSVR